MQVAILLSLFFTAALAQVMQEAPTPYSFNYASNTEDGGSSSHQEEGDGNGRVSGSYTVTDLEGHNRMVEYIADENGFRATVRTNEPGTANINPADVVMESSADAGAVSYTLGGAGPAAPRVVAPAPRIMAPGPRIMAPAPRIMAPGPRMPTDGRAGTRYVLVPVTDPRARGYSR